MNELDIIGELTTDSSIARILSIHEIVQFYVLKMLSY